MCIRDSFFFFFFFSRPVIRLHSCLLFASRTASGSVHLYQSVMSSDYLLDSLPRGRSTILNITVFISRWSSIPHMCPNSFILLCLIRSIMVHCLSTFSLTLLLVTPSFQHTFSILLYIAPHLKCQAFSEVCCLYSPRFNSVEQTGEHTRNQHIDLGFDDEITVAP